MDGPCSREELRACLRDLAKTNRLLMAYRPILHWLDGFKFPPCANPIRILDVGCGYGDGLRRIEQWAKKRGISVELIGIDLNPDAVAIAAEASKSKSKIQWVAADIFAFTPKQPVDIVINSLFTHHLREADVIRFLQWMERHATLGWFINDLSRAAIPYYTFQAFAKLFRLHPFVQHDGPVSIRRSFVPEDWRRMCAAAGISGHNVVIKGFKPARLCVGRRKPV
jgi:2-polyprenyl-3-methyl-5-hydroxy-6-metoxy-1,4-benzoquinol methylase